MKRILPLIIAMPAFLITGCRSEVNDTITIIINPAEGAFPNKQVGEIVELVGKKGKAINSFTNYPGEPTADGKDFLYYIDSDCKQYSPRDIVFTTSNTITLTAKYSECPHTEFTDFTVVDNQLYGICPLCHKNVLIPDKDLSTFVGKFLMVEDNRYVMHNITEMDEIFSKAPSHSTLEMYFINGEYDLAERNESTGGVNLTLNLHGLLKNDKKTFNATINCTKNISAPYPRKYYYMDLNFDHLIMKGEKNKAVGFYLGMKANSISYKYCHFNGKQSLYSPTVICTDCIFDSTQFTDEADYAIYTYSCINAQFTRCDFVSDGKAIKVYCDGSGVVPLINTNYCFENCNFTIRESLDVKAAIQVDSQHQSDDNKYKITIINCSQVGYSNLYKDTSIHTEFITSN